VAGGKKIQLEKEMAYFEDEAQAEQRDCFRSSIFQIPTEIMPTIPPYRSTWFNVASRKTYLPT